MTSAPAEADMPPSLPQRRFGLRPAAGRGRQVAGAPRRQADPERRAPLPPAALGADRAAVQLDEVADDRQAEAETAMAPLRAGVPLAKPLEDVRQKCFRDARSGIA